MLSLLISRRHSIQWTDETALWEILLKTGYPTDFVTIIRSFHEGMRASAIENGEVSPNFEVTNGTKQGCGLAPLLFVNFFSMMLRVAFRDCNLSIQICYRTVRAEWLQSLNSVKTDFRRIRQ